VKEVKGKAVPSKSDKVVELLLDLEAGTKFGKGHEDDIGILTDYAAAANALTKILDKDIKLIKTAIMTFGRATKTKTLMGRGGGSFTIGPSTTTTYGGATELAKLLKKYDKLDLFDEMTSVKVTEVKKYLGEATLESEGFMSKGSKEYGRITLKTK